MSKILGFVVLASVMVGCAASSEEPKTEPSPTESDEAEVASMKWFDCSGGNSDEQMSHVEIGRSAKALKVTDLSKDAMVPDDGKLDPDYHPTSSTYQGAIRYSGFGKISDAWDEVSSVDFIVSKEIQANANAGKIWMRTAGPEGGGTTSYWCKVKAGPIKVDTHKNARFICDLKLLCTHDNPPGDTCIDTAFIQQSGDASKLRTTYLDHFGVHVEERKVEVGGSSKSNRDATSYKGEWSGHKIDLKYRGGVTYTGTFTMPDGRKTDAQCNDLAMLDN